MNRNGTQTLGLEGRIALVSGASRGLGQAIARKLCACGCDVFVNYARSDADASRTLADLSGLKGTVQLLKGDIAEPGAMPELIDRIRQDRGRLDIFVHNAASYHPMDAVGADPQALYADLRTAIDPLISGAASLADAMTADHGRVIAISSNGAGSVIPQYVSIGMAKAALESLVRYLAAELAGRAIAVNAVATAKLDKGPGTPGGPVLELLASRTPAGRLTTPADVADVVALLCTDEAAWIHGQVITVDGGLGIRA